MITTEEQIENAMKTAKYSDSERAAYEHGMRWGMRRSAHAARMTGEVAAALPGGEIVAAACKGLADVLDAEAGK